MTIQDLYPTRGSAEVITPRQDPVVWGPSEGLESFEQHGFLSIQDLLVGQRSSGLLSRVCSA